MTKITTLRSVFLLTLLTLRSSVQRTSHETLLQTLLKDNMEMKKMMKEIVKNPQPTTVTNNNITNNINIFLNEKCQNAMEMSEFIRGIKFCAYREKNHSTENRVAHFLML